MTNLSHFLLQSLRLHLTRLIICRYKVFEYSHVRVFKHIWWLADIRYGVLRAPCLFRGLISLALVSAWDIFQGNFRLDLLLNDVVHAHLNNVPFLDRPVKNIIELLSTLPVYHLMIVD